MYSKVPKRSLYGVKGLLCANVNVLRRGLFMARSVNTISANKTIHFKFILDSSYDIFKFPVCNTVQNVSQCGTDCQKFDDFDAFCANFDFSGTHVLLSKQIENLEKCLYAHQNVFVTKENRQLGFSNLVQHEIHLKPIFVPKYQRPYRLPPDKREVLHR